MLPEKSSYQITRYLTSSIEVSLKELYKFLIKFHWNVKEDFKILKQHGRSSLQYLERKVLVIPSFGEKLSFLEAFLLLYYFYGTKHNLNVERLYNDITNVQFWNVLARNDIQNELNISLNKLLEFYEKYSTLTPYTINTEVDSTLMADSIIVDRNYSNETNVLKFSDRESSTLLISSFRPIVLVDESKFYLVHRFSKPYRYSKLVRITEHDIHFHNQSFIATFTLPDEMILYDSYLLLKNNKKSLRLILKYTTRNLYAYTDLDLENYTFTPVEDYQYNIFSHQTIEDSIQLWNKYRTVITTNNCNSLELKVLQGEAVFRNTIIPTNIYDVSRDPYTLQIYLSDEFIFIFNWTKLTYAIYKFYQDVWEVGSLEEINSLKDLRAYLIPDTKNKVKIVVSKDCGVRTALHGLNLEDIQIEDEGLVYYSDSGINEVGDGIPQFTGENLIGEGLVYLREVEGIDFGDVCSRLNEVSFDQFLLEIKEKLDLFCKNPNRLLVGNYYYWLNSFDLEKITVYEVEVKRNNVHSKRVLDKKLQYANFLKSLFNENLPLVPATIRTVSFTTSYGSSLMIYDSLTSFRMLRLYSVMNKDEKCYYSMSPYNCGDLNFDQVLQSVKRTIRQLVCVYGKEFKKHFVYSNDGLEKENNTITRFNPEVVEENITVFESMDDLNRLRDEVLRILIPTIYSQLSYINLDDALKMLILSVTQYLGLSSEIVYSYNSNIVGEILEVLIECFFPIHSYIIGGKLNLVFDDLVTNSIAVDDSLLISLNLDFHDHINIEDISVT